MKSVSIVYDQNGKPLLVSDTPAAAVIYDLPHSGVLEVNLLDGITVDDFYIKAGCVTLKPPKPTPHHVFDYTTKQWIDPRTPETEWPLVRAKRDRLIAATDWTQLPDVPLATKEMWANYRQALRDVTLQADPFNIVWPTTPQ